MVCAGAVPNQHQAIVSVEDTGAGMDESVMVRDRSSRFLKRISHSIGGGGRAGIGVTGSRTCRIARRFRRGEKRRAR